MTSTCRLLTILGYKRYGPCRVLVFAKFGFDSLFLCKCCCSSFGVVSVSCSIKSFVLIPTNCKTKTISAGFCYGYSQNRQSASVTKKAQITSYTFVLQHISVHRSTTICSTGLLGKSQLSLGSTTTGILAPEWSSTHSQPLPSAK